VEKIQSDLVGLLVMTFQRKTAKGIIRLLHSLRSNVRVVVGGYDPSMAPEAHTDDTENFVDFIVRGEGDYFSRVVACPRIRNWLRANTRLSFRERGRFRHNPDRPLKKLNTDEIRLPNRKARVLRGYTMLGRRWMSSRLPAAVHSIAASVQLLRCAKIIAMRKDAHPHLSGSEIKDTLWPRRWMHHFARYRAIRQAERVYV
jgi:hypothetical protein